jgi:hypothetical protein
VHFADAYLVAAAAELHLPVSSFDRDLDRFGDVKRLEPNAMAATTGGPVVPRHNRDRKPLR